MIEYENSAEILSMDFDNIIPFEFDESNIVAFDVLKDIAEEFEIRFSDDAFDFLYKKIKPYTDKWGYTLNEKYLYSWDYTYIIDQINTDLILDNTVKDGERFVTIIDGNIVSDTKENPYQEGSLFRDIAVSTDINYRNRGYAASNVAAHAKYLEEMNLKATYRCDKFNIASQRVAEKVGFKLYGKKYYYVCEKNGE